MHMHQEIETKLVFSTKCFLTTLLVLRSAFVEKLVHA